jgi:N-acetylmuramoyl-L-alanine amidase
MPHYLRHLLVTHVLLASGLLLPAFANAIGQCPPIGQSPSCAMLITISPNGALSIQQDPAIGPYDGSDDQLVGVVNNSSSVVFGIQLSGQNIFGFDGDGIVNYGGAGNPNDPTGYAGPGVTYTVQDVNNGIVNFENGLPDQGFAYFGLEGAPSISNLSRSVTIDPGHGYSCPNIKQDAGAVGKTNFATPPLGFLHEDDLALSISLQLQTLLTASGYSVTMTKTNVNKCPSIVERGAIANKARSNIFVSVHLNAPRFSVFGIGLGTSGLYHPDRSSAEALATFLSNDVSSSLGTSNRGAKARDDVGVLKATVTRMAASLVEVARLSGTDEELMHDPTSIGKAATGIQNGIADFFKQ